jgi:hypothetical protein
MYLRTCGSFKSVKHKKRLGTDQEYRVVVPARQATWVGGIGFLESIPRLLKSLKIPAGILVYFRSLSPASDGKHTAV